MRGDDTELERSDGGNSAGNGGDGIDLGGSIDPSSIEPAKSKRGWPKGKPRGTGNSSDNGGAKSGTAPRAASGKFTAKKDAPALDVGVITMGVQMFGAFVAQAVARNDKAFQEILALTDEESAKIADKAANVAKYYDIPVSPVTQAWIGLAGTAGSIYAGKIMAYRALKAMGGTPAGGQS